MEAPTYPGWGIDRHGRLEVLPGLRHTPQLDPSCTTLVAPECLLSWDPAARVSGQHPQAVAEGGLGLTRAPGPERGRSGFEPDQPIAGIRLLELADDPDRVVVSLLPVVEEDQRKASVGLGVARVDGRLLDHLDAPLLSASEADHVGEPAQRERQVGHDVSIRADDQPRILAARVQRQHPFVCVERATCGSEPGELRSFDRREVGGPEPDRDPQLVVCVRVIGRCL